MSLHDLGSGQEFLRTWQSTFSTAQESFTLGLQEGDSSNFLLGSLTGTLQPGREYALRVDAHYGTYQESNAAAGTASGFVEMLLVPEASSGLLLTAGLLVAARRARGYTA